MADVRVEVDAPSVVEQLSERDRDILFGKASVSDRKPTIPLEALSSQQTVETEDDPEVTVEELSDGYKTVQARVNDLLSLLGERAKDLVLVIGPEDDDLFRAANKLFDSKEPVREITFDMYLKCLEYSKDIGLELGRRM